MGRSAVCQRWCSDRVGCYRQEKKENENPGVGVILCASKDEQVVEYAMSRSMSPTMVSQYTLKLIDKKILEEKLKEINDIVEENNNKE